MDTYTHVKAMQVQGLLKAWMDNRVSTDLTIKEMKELLSLMLKEQSNIIECY